MKNDGLTALSFFFGHNNSSRLGILLGDDLELASLIQSTDHLAKLEVNMADIIVFGQIIWSIFIVSVVYFNFEILLLFKEVIDLKLRDKVGIVVIPDSLGLANLPFHGSASLIDHLIYDHKRIRFTKGVHLWEVPERER